MVNREIDIEGFGKVIINPINFKDKEYSNVDLNGNEVKWISGKMETIGHFEDENGNEIPKNQVLKRIEVEGENIDIPKFKPTTEIQNDDIEVVEDNQSVYTAIERKMYKVFTETKKLRELILEQNKTLKFPISFGNGYKLYEGYLTNWKGQMVLFGVRGDINKVLDKYEDDIVEIEVEAIPNINKKKLLKAIA